MAHSILTHFADLPDPRSSHGRLHRLSDLLAIAICGVLCGAESWVEVEQFGNAKRQWMATFLDLPHGIPSHDTFGRVFAALDPDAFEQCFTAWTATLAEQNQGRLIAVDGKTIRRSFAHAWNKAAAIQLVSAFAQSNGVVFGQLAAQADSNEVKAIPELLELLDLTGATVSIDAAGTHKAIARQITDAGGDYVLALKQNQKTLHQKVKLLLDEAIGLDFAGMKHDRFEQVEADHGRIETRRVWCTPEVHWLRGHQDWPKLASVAAVECTRQVIGGATSVERRYFISSLDGGNAQALADAVRGHWGIENRLHWSLDVSFNEDQCRVRQGQAAQNFSRLRRIALNLLRKDKTLKVGIKAKRLRAGWDHDYLLKVLSG